MKTVGTITEILDLFYKRIDDISIHTKHTVANGKYGYELKDGILYHRGKQIGVCNKFVPFVIRLNNIEDYLYIPLVKLKNQKIRGKINVDIYNICRENTNIIYNDIHSILSALWYGVNQNLTVTRHILEKDVTNQRFADVRTHQIKYNNARKGWRSALKDILIIGKEHNIDVNKIIDKAYTLYNTYVEYKGYKKLYNIFDTTINLKDNIRITLSPKENLIISGKILYWQTIRSKKVNTAIVRIMLNLRNFGIIQLLESNLKILLELNSMNISTIKKLLKKQELRNIEKNLKF